MQVFILVELTKRYFGYFKMGPYASLLAIAVKPYMCNNL